MAAAAMVGYSSGGLTSMSPTISSTPLFARSNLQEPSPTSFLTPERILMMNDMSASLAGIGGLFCLAVLGFVAVLYSRAETRRALDRLSFRLLIGVLLANCLYSIGYIVCVKVQPQFWCVAGVWSIQFFLGVTNYFILCIALNLQLVLVHSVNTLRLEMWYIVGTILLNFVITLPPAIKGKFGWDPVIGVCWLTSNSQQDRLRWQIATNIVWILLAVVVTAVTAVVTVGVLYRHRFTSLRIIKQNNYHGNSNTNSTNSTYHSRRGSKELDTFPPNTANDLHNAPNIVSNRLSLSGTVESTSTITPIVPRPGQGPDLFLNTNPHEALSPSFKDAGLAGAEMTRKKMHPQHHQHRQSKRWSTWGRWESREGRHDNQVSGKMTTQLATKSLLTQKGFQKVILRISVYPLVMVVLNLVITIADLRISTSKGVYTHKDYVLHIVYYALYGSRGIFYALMAILDPAILRAWRIRRGISSSASSSMPSMGTTFDKEHHSSHTHSQHDIGGRSMDGGDQGFLNSSNLEEGTYKSPNGEAATDIGPSGLLSPKQHFALEKPSESGVTANHTLPVGGESSTLSNRPAPPSVLTPLESASADLSTPQRPSSPSPLLPFPAPPARRGPGRRSLPVIRASSNPAQMWSRVEDGDPEEDGDRIEIQGVREEMKGRAEARARKKEERNVGKLI